MYVLSRQRKVTFYDKNILLLIFFIDEQKNILNQIKEQINNYKLEGKRFEIFSEIPNEVIINEKAINNERISVVHYNNIFNEDIIELFKKFLLKNKEYEAKFLRLNNIDSLNEITEVSAKQGNKSRLRVLVDNDLIESAFKYLKNESIFELLKKSLEQEKDNEENKNFIYNFLSLIYLAFLDEGKCYSGVMEIDKKDYKNIFIKDLFI